MKRLALFGLLFSFSAAHLAHSERVGPEVKMWSRAGFKSPEFSTLEVPAPESALAGPTTHVLDATIVLFRNTGWTREQMEAHLKRTNEIYAPCGIRLGEIKLVTSDAFQGKLDLNSRWSSDADDVLIANATPIEKRPVIYLMRNILAQNGGPGEGAFTDIVNFWVPLTPVSQNTLWISSAINQPDYGNYRDMEEDGRSVIKSRDPSYNVIAHEIAHLLGNQGHETELKEKNLLNGSSELLNDHLLPRQCEKFKLSPLLRKINS